MTTATAELRVATASPRLPHDRVDVWIVDTSSARDAARNAELLSLDEAARARRFHFEKDRVEFINSRAMLRKMVGSYLAVAPERVRFRYNDFGKPQLHESMQLPELGFNLAHSHGVTLVAATVGRSIGIDVEAVRREPGIDDDLARTCFSPSELEELRRVAPARWNHAFFTCWTRKEAFLKACGGGLSMPLQDFDVSVDPLQPARIQRCEWEPIAGWQLEHLEPLPGYVGAVAISAEGNGSLSPLPIHTMKIYGSTKV